MQRNLPDHGALLCILPVRPDVDQQGDVRCIRGAQVIGCSTAGEIVSDRVLKDSIVAMAFDDRTVRDAAFSVVTDVTSPDSLADAVRRLGEDIGTPLGELDFRKYVGIILIDGLSGSEERVMDRLGDLTNVTFIGGSAGTGA
ncbi:MAG TPA: FIST N-terminal domain-containing protein [Methanoculleus sp.]|nr:FIST N-terminal domain-containing protein [Methanoculleus sp.]